MESTISRLTLDSDEVETKGDLLDAVANAVDILFGVGAKLDFCQSKPAKVPWKAVNIVGVDRECTRGAARVMCAAPPL